MYQRDCAILSFIASVLVHINRFATLYGTEDDDLDPSASGPSEESVAMDIDVARPEQQQLERISSLSGPHKITAKKNQLYHAIDKTLQKTREEEACWKEGKFEIVGKRQENTRCSRQEGTPSTLSTDTSCNRCWYKGKPRAELFWKLGSTEQPDTRACTQRFQ
ncbi:hypothetical protein BJV82DRAFT_672889 [Fennellomyces sp. T-0311]|nr:hypothetical protein BJV82DRAFT_672889 [Fennellomyces sp. T-0311]